MQSIQHIIDSHPARPLLFIAGPTASGKSKFAIKMAYELQKSGQSTTIINMDSAQIYADLSLLSARPNQAEMGGIAHKLFGVRDGALPYSAAQWAKDAKREIDKAWKAKQTPILVGGTGFYMKVLIEGISSIPEIDPIIRSQVRDLPLPLAHEQLCALDGWSKQHLSPQDHSRICRALEVILSTGKSLHSWQNDKRGGLLGDTTIFIDLILPERKILYERCDMRFIHMIENGAIEETKRLLSRNLPHDLPVMRAIGVPSIAQYLSGMLKRAEMIEDGQRRTRQYAKRQYTWFRHQVHESWATSINFYS